MRRRTLAREFALRFLYQMDIHSCSNDEQISQQIIDDDFFNQWGCEEMYSKEEELSEGICSYAKRIVQGVIENIKQIDCIIQRRAENWTLKRMSYIDRNILRLAVYELLYEGSIPPNVAMNEAIDIAKKYGDEDSGKFVNGILDRINKEDRKKD
jgi:N utilization substance protein B